MSAPDLPPGWQFEPLPTGHNGLLSTDELREWIGIQRVGLLEAWLRRHRVATFPGRTGPITTLEAVNRALAGEAAARDEGREVEFGDPETARAS